MTAEVIVANSNGIALAADSAVTVGGRKIYNSAIKLFSMSKIYPVCAMIFGNASLVDIPWEVIIKSYRKDLNSKHFDSLNEYAKDFIEYICTCGKFKYENTQEQWIRDSASSYFKLIRDDFFKLTKQIIDKKGKIEEEEIPLIAEHVINSHHKEISARKILENFDHEFEKTIRKKYIKIFSKIKNEIFQNLPIKARLSSKLYDIATFIHTREIFSNAVSGLVVSGYGEEEIFPSIISYEIEGIIEGRLKHRIIPDKSYKIKNGNDCIIIPFAQEEMVQTFMNGMHPSVGDMISNYLQQIFNRLPDIIDLNEPEISSDISERVKSKLKSDSSILLKKFFQSLKEHIRDDQVVPVMSMVNVLPKDELAAMAESMVNLTVFKRKVTNSLETVGGPVDVAIISKGDGLVWVKRKHYFKAELNNHFFKNYFRGIEDGQED